MIAGFFGTIYTLWLYTGWLPYYLEHERHMSIARVGIVAAIPYFFGCVGAIVGGWLCDFLTRRGWTPIGGRKLLVSMRSVRHFPLHRGNSVCAIQRPRSDVHFHFAVPDLYRQQRRMGHGADRGAEPVHRVAGLHSELRRLSGRRARPDGHRRIVQRTGSFAEALMLSAALALISAVAYLLLVKQPIPAPQQHFAR